MTLGQSFSRLRQVVESRIGTAIIFAAMTVVAPLLAFSETTIKGMVDRWLSQCFAVIETTQEDSAAIVRLFTFGDTPTSLPLTFAVDRGLVDRVSLVNHVETAPTGTQANLLVHPLANQRCPGDLCPNVINPTGRLTIRLKPVTANYLYQFRVVTNPAVEASDVKVYVRPLQNEDITCRVEQATAFNYVARQSKQIQLLLLFLGVVVLTLLVGYFKERRGGKE